MLDLPTLDEIFAHPELPVSPQSRSLPDYLNDQAPAMSLSEASSSASASNPPRQLTPRRRRIISRRYGSQGRNSISYIDADMSDLMQTTRMPSKRKATSSAAKPARTQHIGSRIALETSFPTDLPWIDTATVFGAANANQLRIPTPRVSDIGDSTDDEDENELIDLSLSNGPPFYAGRDAQRRVNRATIAALANDDFSKRDTPCQFSSAILVMPEMHTRASNSTNSVDGDGGRVRYLPLGPLSAGTGHTSSSNGSVLTVVASRRDRIRRSQDILFTSDITWPPNDLPVELFDLITAHLSRDDVKSMRMVNKEFERKVSRSLFHTSVVPFNTELYDMIDEDKRNLTRGSPGISRVKAKQKITDRGQLPTTDAGGLMWQNAKEDKEGKVYRGHGLRVFQGFGPHIKRFGMTFEVSEKQLTQPPVKKELDHVDSYHGAYDWPSTHYARFANLAGLENTADETSRMKAAFSKLEIVQELALSIDNGLGWLNGPDKSLRSRIFERPSPVFGTKYDILDRSAAAAADFWDALQTSHQSFAPYSNLKEVTLEHRQMNTLTPLELEGMRHTICANTQRWPSIESTKVMSSRFDPAHHGLGVVYTSGKSSVINDIEGLGLHIVPSSLRKEQKEWLLETQWAQQAFLESYMLAVIDNGPNFEKVTTLRVTKLSSRFLPMLARGIFWESLPCLTDVTLHVAADWRSVEKDNAGLAAVKSERPSEAVRMFYRDILRERISTKETIKKLNVGWFGGGENADGMYARNANLLPAPMTQLDHSTANSSIFGLVFKSVEHLTLCNCWISPPVLEGLVRSHTGKALQKLTLDSVSLTAHPRFPAANGQGGAAAQLAQAAVAMQHLANNPQLPPNQLNFQPGAAGYPQHIAQLGPAFMQGATPQQLAMLHQQWTQHMQNMQQLFAANPNMNANQVNANPANFPPLPANAPAPQAAPANQGWIHGHREGSWPQLIDLVSPGPVFDDYLPQPQPWEEPRPPRPETGLRTIEFISCGYAKLVHNSAFDQVLIEPDVDHLHSLSPWFRARWTSLKPLMLETRDRYIGQIVQYMPQREQYALQFGWGLTQGWSDRRKAEEVEFDGLLPGGTGRFSGTIERGMALVGRPAE